MTRRACLLAEDADLLDALGRDKLDKTISRDDGISEPDDRRLENEMRESPANSLRSAVQRRLLCLALGARRTWVHCWKRWILRRTLKRKKGDQGEIK